MQSNIYIERWLVICLSLALCTKITFSHLFTFSIWPVVRGSIRNVTHDSERQTSVVEVQKGRVYRQRSGVFWREPNHSGSWHGYIHTLLQCGVKAGAGQFLFTGAELFGEAWLGCAPRFKDFQILYHSAKRAHHMPCDFSLNWGEVLERSVIVI